MEAEVGSEIRVMGEFTCLAIGKVLKSVTWFEQPIWQRVEGERIDLLIVVERDFLPKLKEQSSELNEAKNESVIIRRVAV